MSELEELHDLIESAVEDVCYNAESYGPSSLAYGVAADAAKALTAAGYRKPRTITTAEELDGLAEHSVVKSDEGAVWESDSGVWYETASRLLHVAADIALPATVLYEPTA